MAPTKQLKVQDTVFDLDTFSEVTLVKVVDFQPIASVDEALTLLSNDSEKLLNVINRGLESEARKIARTESNGWHTFTDEGEINGEFAGTPADITKVNSLVLTLAKTVFGYSKDLGIEEKRKSKESAKTMIQGTPAIREGLKKSAALGAEDGE